MNNLPQSVGLNVGKLAQIFDSTAASYKFLLFKSIIDTVQSGKVVIPFEDLALKSISQAWYSIHFYKISYGTSDRMTEWVRQLDAAFEDNVLISELAYHKIYSALKELQDQSYPTVIKFIKEFSALVPYRLISVWFRDELRGKKDNEKNDLILKLSHETEFHSLYQIEKDNTGVLTLRVDENWAQYLKENYAIVEGWWRSKFIEYLQKRNPTVLSLATKLEPPLERNMSQVKSLFKQYYQIKKVPPTCFYTGVEITGSISHDHYLPWSFFGSDPIYNFVPTIKSINSSKSNSIPHEKYLKELASFQFDVFLAAQKMNNNSLIESYLGDLHINANADRDQFEKKLIEFYNPLYLTAINQGFDSGWTAT